MIKKIIITDLTRMKKTRVCVAGYNWSNKTHIRPNIPPIGIDEDYLFENDQLVIKPFAVIEFDFLRHTPELPHSEDWELNTEVRPKFIRMIRKRQEFLETIKDASVSDIFGSPIHNNRYVEVGKGERSLGTGKAIEISSVEYSTRFGRPSYRITFSDENDEYDFSVTDLAFREYCNYLDQQNMDNIGQKLKGLLDRADSVYIRLGLARAWAPDEAEELRHYIFITAIYSFPDYLDGKSYIDLRRQQSSVSNDDIPF